MKNFFKTIKIFNIGLNLKDQIFLFEQFMKGYSFMRATHNLFLKKNINLNSLTADLGSGTDGDYKDYIFKKKNLYENFDLYKKKNKTKIIDLEKKFKLKSKYKNILLFNVLEHIYNNDLLIKSISINLKKNGKLELFVPFMYKFHSDPGDYLRFTHQYLNKKLKESGFKVKISLIAVGQFNVIFEIIQKYIKIRILKYLFSIIFILLNNILKLFSKDYNNYYCGVHCSCIKYK